MSRIARLLRQAAANAGGALDVADVFSTDLWTGTGAARTITNGIDFAGEGGLLWLKWRSGGGISSSNHLLSTTERPVPNALFSNLTSSESTSSDRIEGFNSDGFDLGSNSQVNRSGANYVGWSFRKAPKFFDVVTYAGDGIAGRTISHNLGVTPGMVILKRVDSGGTSWYVWHNALTATEGLALELTSDVFTGRTWWNSTLPNASNFTVGGGSGENASGGTYVAYLFAHDPTGIVQCGSYTGNGSSTGPSINLGWEPQFLMIKNADDARDWVIVDNARGLGAGNDPYLFPNGAGTEQTGDRISTSSTGFSVVDNDPRFNGNGHNMIYMAIKAAA